MSRRRYDPLKEVKMNIGMTTTEAVGWGMAGKITGVVNNPVADKAFGMGSSLAGVPSLVQGSGSIIKSLGVFDSYGKKKKK